MSLPFLQLDEVTHLDRLNDILADRSLIQEKPMGGTLHS